MSNKISIVLITKNAAKTLSECLEQLTSFDEVVVYDNGSEDATIKIASTFSNVQLHQGSFFGFGKTKAHAVNLAKNDWVFALDADEILSDDLVKELLNMTLDENCIYKVQRDNYYNNRHIKCCGWYPETIVRFFNKKMTNYNDVMVHEEVEVKNLSIKNLSYPMKHYSFDSIADFLTKIQKYSEIYADEHKHKKSSSIVKALFRGFFMFFKSYILKAGFKCGFEGFVISFFAGLGTTIKYLKLGEKNLYDK